jgi:hypothetical protein
MVEALENDELVHEAPAIRRLHDTLGARARGLTTFGLAHQHHPRIDGFVSVGVASRSPGTRGRQSEPARPGEMIEPHDH